MLSQKATWTDALGIGVVAPLVLFGVSFVIGPSYEVSLVAAFAALCGLYQFERLWIQAGQSVPLS